MLVLATAPTEKLHVEGNIQTNSAFIGSADNRAEIFSKIRS